MKNRGLGKGLNALISENVMDISPSEVNDGDEVKEGNIFKVNINDIEPNKSQPRSMFDEDKLEELSESISQFGIIQPLIVTKKGEYYEIIAGERRWRAAKRAGLKEIPIIISDLSSQEILEVSLIENIQREDLNPIEEARAFDRLINEFKLKQDEVAKKVCKSRSAVANTLRLLNLNERVQQILIQGSITSGHARALLAIIDEEQQYDIATKVMDEDLSVRQTEILIKKILNASKENEKQPVVSDLEPIFKELEDRVRDIMGTKVNIIDKGKKGGKIEIEYYSSDDLERIIYLIESK